MRSKKALSAVILTCTVLLGLSVSICAGEFGKVAGSVVDARSRQPIGDARVILTAGHFRTEAATGADGSYIINNVPPGRYRLAFSYEDYETLQYSGIEVRTDSTTRFDAEMRQPYAIYYASPGEIVGTLIDAVTRIPVSDAKVDVIGKRMTDSTLTDSHGSYMIMYVPPGKYEVVFTRFGYKTIKVANVEVRSNSTTIIEKALAPAVIPGEVIEVEYQEPNRSPVYEEVTDPEPKQIPSTDLKQTVISAHMEAPIEPGKNVLYCSTFQIAWNMMQDSIIKEEILLEGDPEIARMLNKQLSTAADISEDCYVAAAGFLTQGFLDSINQALQQKFGNQAPPKVEEVIIPDLPTFFAYAYLCKNLQFEPIFKVSGQPIYFKSGSDTTQLKAFEVESQEQRDQVSVLNYRDDNDFVISLRSKSPDDEIILAKVSPQGTMLATIQSVQERMAGSPPSKVESDEPVKIPKCDFNVIHSFEQLINKDLLNPGWEGWFVSKAVQWTRFRLNEKGIILKSEARFGVAVGAHPVDMTRRPRHFILDKPFLICLREKGGRYPYFAMWVDNPELMLKWE